MIRNRTIQKSAALLLFLPLVLAGGAGLTAGDGLADDGSAARGKDIAKADDARADVGAETAADRRKAGNADAVPRPAAKAPTRSATTAPKRSPARKQAPARNATNAARNAAPPAEDPKLDKEILDALKQGPGGGPGGQAVFQGQINVNGQTMTFNNPRAFNNAMRQPPRMGFPMPMPGFGMPGFGMPGMGPGMPFNQFQGNFMAPAVGGNRATAKRSATTPKRKTATKKATPKPARAKEEAPEDVPEPPKPMPPG